MLDLSYQLVRSLIHLGDVVCLVTSLIISTPLILFFDFQRTPMVYLGMPQKVDRMET